MWTPALIFCYIVLVVDGVSIRDLKAPEAVKVGEELILDCDFTYNQDEVEEIVVKWFYNGSPSPFYQWVPDLSMGPQIIDKAFFDSIDLEYRVEESDQYTEYRALRLPSVTREQAGDYRCQVSSFTSEATMEKTVTVFVPPTTMTVTTSPTEDTVTVSCSSEGMFPAPLLSLSWTEQSVPHSSPTPASIVSTTPGVYSASLSLSLPLAAVSGEDLAVCVLSFPGTHWERREETELIRDKIPEKFLQMFAERERGASNPEYQAMEAAADYDQIMEEPDSHLERVANPMEHVLVMQTASAGQLASSFLASLLSLAAIILFAV